MPATGSGRSGEGRRFLTGSVSHVSQVGGAQKLDTDTATPVCNRHDVDSLCSLVRSLSTTGRLVGIGGSCVVMDFHGNLDLCPLYFCLRFLEKHLPVFFHIHLLSTFFSFQNVMRS